MNPIDPLAVQCDEHEAPRSIGIPCAAGGACCAHRHARATLARIQQRAGKAPVPYRGKWRDRPAPEATTGPIAQPAAPSPVLVEDGAARKVRS